MSELTLVQKLRSIKSTDFTNAPEVLIDKMEKAIALAEKQQNIVDNLQNLVVQHIRPSPSFQANIH